MEVFVACAKITDPREERSIMDGLRNVRTWRRFWRRGWTEMGQGCCQVNDLKVIPRERFGIIRRMAGMGWIAPIGGKRAGGWWDFDNT